MLNITINSNDLEMCPILDRVDTQIELDAVPYEDLTDKRQEESSKEIKKREDPHERFKGNALKMKTFFNAQMDAKRINKYYALNSEIKAFMKSVYNSLKFSSRAYSRILKMGRTITDLAGAQEIAIEHLAEAVNYRSLDRKYWGRQGEPWILKSL